MEKAIIDVGDFVVCDIYNRDYTNSDEKAVFFLLDKGFVRNAKIDITKK